MRKIIIAIIVASAISSARADTSWFPLKNLRTGAFVDLNRGNTYGGVFASLMGAFHNLFSLDLGALSNFNGENMGLVGGSLNLRRVAEITGLSFNQIQSLSLGISYGRTLTGANKVFVYGAFHL